MSPARVEGFSLLEMCIAMTVLGMVLGAVGLTVLTGTGAWKQAEVIGGLEGQGHRMLERIAGQFTDAGSASLVPNPVAPFGSSRLDFRRNTGYAGGAVIWNNTSRIQLQYDPAEKNDGLDNNENGLVDEGQVVLVQDLGLSTEETIPWGGFVREYLEGELPNGADDNANGLIDERGLCFSISGSTLTLRLTLEKRDAQNRLVTVTRQTAVRVRN